MSRSLTSDDPSKRSLADDPTFLASLSDLDSGLVGEPSKPKVQAPISASSAAAATTTRAARVTQAPRHLSELFPSTPGEQPAFEALTIEPSVAGGRRLMPILDVAQTAAPPASREPPRRVERSGYEGFYGFSEPPFTLDADPRFLYHSGSYDHVAQQVLDAIRRRDGIALLTGDAGVGKTTLCRAVIDQLDRRTLTSFVADPLVTPEALLKTVLVDFGVISASDVAAGKLSKASRADLHTALRDFLYSLAPLQAFAVIIVDEAQRLSTELLEEVRVLADTGGDEQLLQLLLVGEPSLLGKLSRRELRPTFGRVTARASLGPMAADEIAGYIAHRLAVVTEGSRVAFDSEAAERLYALSGGVPRVVNLLCDRALAAGYKASAKTIGVRFVERAAEALDLMPPSPPPSVVVRMVLAGVFALLVLMGAVAGAFVFRSDVARMVEKWQARPNAPDPPRLEVPPGYRPAPPSDTRGGT
jgi:general secretion pathway protein A